MNSVNNFLTVDLDYFGITQNQNKKDKEVTLSFFNNLFNSKIPFAIVQDHHKILPYLNRKKYDKIINVDFHSDIVTEDKEYIPIFYENYKIDLNEGTWANFYKYRKDTIFEWRFPNKDICLYKGNGICGYFGDYKSEWHPTKMGYKRVQYKEGVDKLPLDTVKFIAYCISPKWYCKKNIQFIFDKYPILDICLN